MTIIVAQKTATGVLMGADCVSTEGSRVFRRGTPKLMNITPRLAVGVAGKSRIGEFVIGSREWPARGERTPGEYRTALADFFEGLLRSEEKDAAFWAIVASFRDIYYVTAPGCVLLIDAPYCALGSAELVALGALYVWNLDRPEMSETTAKNGLAHAMDACAEHIDSIRPPWLFVKTTAPD
jgi:20S proteasome alpha/beta subunit